jgi:2-polyprenyl-3-methyl-5-hydroxy-6-metoxy-1,4-benzoquinol methylase
MSSQSPTEAARRTGDTIRIDGDYQYRARTDGFVVQRFWHALKERTIARHALPTAEMRVLDVGCGSGVTTEFLSRHAREAVGVDGNASAIEFAGSRWRRDNLVFRHGLADELGFADASFDAVYCLEVVEHLEHAQARRTVNGFARLLKPGGLLFLTTPNYRSPWPVVEWTMDALRLAPQMADHQHVWHPRKRTFRDLAAPELFEEVVVGRAFGMAPFLSVLGWGFAEVVDGMETRVGNPFGNLLFGVWRKR